MTRNWIQAASKGLEGQRRPVFTERTLRALILQERGSWGIPASYSSARILDALLEAGVLHQIKIRPPSGASVARLAVGEVSDYSVALSIRPNSYLSHASALVLHNLTEQLPGSIFVNQEQSQKPTGGRLTQESIDRAFARPARKSNYVWQYGERRITLISGKHTSRLGVIPFELSPSETVDVSGLERTLIDAVVRPQYAGGVFQVLQAFKLARERISPPQLIGILRQVGHLYPYHQALGVYMEAAGYPPFILEQLRSVGMAFDFYLTHDMRDKRYAPTWRTFIPSGFPLPAQGPLQS